MPGNRGSVRPRDRTLKPKTNGFPAWLRAGLYLVFGSLLLIPLVRRMRRRPSWLYWRIGLALAGLGGVVWTWTETVSPLWTMLSALPVIPALVLGRLRDPDAERILQRRHRAEYLLNGGEHEGERCYLLIREKHLMLVPREEEEVRRALEIPRITRILVDGETYVPVYVSEAKDPPVRAEAPLVDAVARMELVLHDGQTLVFHYEGAFAKHLAETAAHGVYSVRERLRSPQPAEFTRISG